MGQTFLFIAVVFWGIFLSAEIMASVEEGQRIFNLTIFWYVKKVDAVGALSDGCRRCPIWPAISVMSFCRKQKEENETLIMLWVSVTSDSRQNCDPEG